MSTTEKAPGAEWYLGAEGRQHGPLTIAQLRQAVAEGRAPAGSLVWKAGMPNWIAWHELPELAALVPPDCPSDPPRIAISEKKRSESMV